jgi:cyclohexanone monooxygenase
MTTRNASNDHVDAVVVGAGFSGLYAVWRLNEMGLSVKAFDAGHDVGGVWYWNRYPGAQTDTPQEAYQYTFDEDLRKSWSFSRRFPPQHEVLAYLHHVADRFGLRRFYRFATTVVSAVFDDESGRWTITTDDGKSVTAKYFITALGAVSDPVLPDIPGFDDFEGDILFTNRWPHDPPDLRGKRIALIGVGASGVQITPHLAAAASELTVFQRTPNYVVPTGNRPLTDDDRREIADNYDDVKRRVRGHHAAFPFEARVGVCAATSTPEDRARIFEESWIRGGFSFLYEGFDDLDEDDEANRMASEFLRSKIRQIVRDPKTAADLCPDYRYGSKRPPTGDGYYQAFNLPHVALVNLRTDPIVDVTRSAIRTSERVVEVDTIVLALGFDIGIGAYSKIDIRGPGGVRLADHWSRGASTFNGISVHGFPNMFTLGGPHVPFANVPPGAELEGGWVADLIGHMIDNGIAWMQPTAAAEASWNRHVVDVAGADFIEDAIKANSYLVSANIADRQPNVVLYLGGHDHYADKLEAESARGYPSFETAGGGKDSTAEAGLVTCGEPVATSV